MCYAYKMHSMPTVANVSLLTVLLLLVSVCNAFDADEDVLFKLYKRDSPKKFTILDVNRSRIVSDARFDPELPTRIHIHGFLPKDEIIDRYRDLYLNNGDYNFIVVDWSEGAFTVNYYLARRRVKEVSVQLFNYERKHKIKFRKQREFQTENIPINMMNY